jgi:hypothetical protein
MYFVIYHDGNHITKTDPNNVFSLPGNYFIFSQENTYCLNEKGGVFFYNKNKEVESFRINKLELIDIKALETYSFLFTIYDHTTDTVKKIPNKGSFGNALSATIKSMIAASEFSSWVAYEKHLKAEEFSLERAKLKEQIDVLKKQNDDLIAQINQLKK